MWGDRVDDTGCVRECLRDRGPHSGRVGLWQEEEGRIGPPKSRGSCFIQRLERSQIKVEDSRGAGLSAHLRGEGPQPGQGQVQGDGL